MQRGYVKLWRKTLDSGWLKNHKLCSLWLWCLLKASHKEFDMIVGCQQVHLMPGDFVFGLNKASDELGISIRSIRTIIDFLRKSKNLTIKTTNKFSIISIVNWDTYQQEETSSDKQTDKQPTSYRQATDNKQECKELKNKKNIYTSEFLEFYTAYPKHKKRDDAFKAWNALNGTRPALEIILSAIEQQKQSEDWLKESGQYIPLPATWLRAGQWADEINEHEKYERTVSI